jgi:ubiquitin carboxyl-terminal hydrolase 8
MRRCHPYHDTVHKKDDPDPNEQHETSHHGPTTKHLEKPEGSEARAAHGGNASREFGNKVHGITGLENLGNSCYMSCIIQCINNTTPLAMYFCNEVYLEHVNHDNNSTRGVVAKEFGAVVRALWSGQYRSIIYPNLKNVVAQHMNQFQGHIQQDSHEFHVILMDLLHEDLKRNSRQPPVRETGNENLSAEEAWSNFQKYNDSIIKLLFYGQQKSTVRCCKCGKESVTFEVFSDLSLPIPSSSKECSLAECINLYLRGEEISGWNCQSCKEEGDAIKKFDIWRPPIILVIHLNRFYYDDRWRKRYTYVDFPLNLEVHHSTGPDQGYVNYKLYAVANHYGSMEGGHYTAYCKNEFYDKWYEFDDENVREISSDDVCSKSAYILFYTSVECEISKNTR